MSRSWKPAFHVGLIDSVGTGVFMAMGGATTVASLVALTGLIPHLTPSFVGALPMGVGFFGIGLRAYMVNVYVGADGIKLRFFLSTRVMPWDTIAAVDTVTVNGVFGDQAREELWFDLTDGSAADTPVCRAFWPRTAFLRNVRTHYWYDRGFEELRAVVAERAAGEITKPATPPPVATQLSARRLPEWAKPVRRKGN